MHQCIINNHLFGNKIKCFGTGLFNGLTKLNVVDVKKNICEINQFFQGNTRIIELKNELKNKCKSPIDALKEDQNALKSNQGALKNGQDVLKMDQGALKKDQGALKSNQDVLKNGQDALK